MIDNTAGMPITAVPRALLDVVKDKRSAPSYRQIYGAVLDGAIPAERINGRWHVNSLGPTIKHFGLVERAAG